MGSIARRILKNMGSRIEVYVTAADVDRETGLLKFWTQLDPNELEQVEQLSERFQFMAQEASSPLPDTLAPGCLCIAKYLEDGRWYRARIENVTGNDVIAYFIDYGNTEIIPRNLVRTKESVGSDVFALPEQATECVLAGVAAIIQHRHIKMGTHGYLKNSLIDQTFIGEPQQLTKDGLEMKLFTQNGDSLSERFILNEFGARRGPGIPIQTATPAAQMKRGYTQITLPLDSRHNLYVSNVASLGQFWIQQASKTQDLDNLMDSISAQYDSLRPGEKTLGAFEVGTPCIAKFSDDGANYRAVVTEARGPKQCTVQFVDFGNSEVKDAASLRAITDDLLQHPAIAIKCSLSGINEHYSSTRAVERFEELTADKELCGKVVGMSGNTCNMLLLDPQGEENADIVSVLVKEGLASRSVENFSAQAKGGASAGAFNAGGDADACKSYVDPKVSQGSKVVIEIIAIRGIDDFSCQLMEDAEAFNAMMDRLQTDYSATSGTSVLRSPTVGQPCCVRFTEDNCWYRALVESVQGREIGVQYVDYGNREVVDASKLMQLKSEYLTLPLQCIDCSLDGAPALEGTEAERARNWLDNHTEENSVATVTSIRGGRFAVILKSVETGVILNDEIKKVLPRQRVEKKIKTPPRAQPLQEESRPMQHSPPRSQPVNSMSASVADLGFWSEVKLAKEADVYISHVEDPSKFFCQLVSQEGHLNLLMDTINSNAIQSKLKQLQQACVGTPCIAQFSEDNSWYRGVIKDQKPGCYRVCFVDYGNEEDVPLGKVSKITEDLMSLPQQAASCCLSGWDLTWKEDKVIQHMKNLAADVEKFHLTVRESKGMSVVQLKWQGKDMLQELRKVRDSIPKEVNQTTKASSPPRQKENLVNSTQPFTIASAVESVKVDQQVMMAASVVKGPTKFFCQLCSQYDQLQELSADMNNHYVGSNPNKEKLNVAISGAFCAAQSSSDGAWYRAKILHEAGPGKVKVKFVDYGDSDVVAVDSLHNLLPQFRNLPTQAIKCRMSGMMQKFEAVVVDQEVMVKVKTKQDGKLEIEYQDDAFGAKVQEVFGPVVPALPIHVGYTKQRNLGNTDQDVYVSHVDNLQKFYIQVCSQSDEIDVLQQKLKTAYSSNASGLVSSTAVGTPCCAKFSEDGDWYRAVVTGHPSPSRVIVQFVDFGNSEEQSTSDLRSLEPEFLQQMVGAVECRLKDIESANLDVANEFLNLTVDKTMKCKFHSREEPYDVQFPDLYEEVKKWQQGYAQQPASILSCPPSNMLAVGVKEEVYVSSGTSPASFWCQLARQEDTLNKLMNSIDAHYSALSNGEGQMRSPVIGSLCVAQFADDGGWYRAKITEVHADACVVTFIDYGNSDKVPRHLIMDIKEDFLVAEQQACLCSLGDVDPVAANWTTEAYDGFLDLTGDKKLLAEVISVDSSTSSHQVILLDLGMSLGKRLIEKGHARPVPVSTRAIRFGSESEELPDQLRTELSGFKKLDIIQGSSEKVYVTVANSLHEFYCQIAAKAIGDLEPLSEKLQSEAESLEDITADSIQGMPCIAKFSDDEQWYRATVLAEKGDMVEVFFVDYGNKQSVPRDQVKALTEDFSDLPAQTVKCALAHIPGSTASDDTAVAEFENVVLESESLTAEFVRQKGCTWIVKLLNDGQPVAEALGVELLEEISEAPELHVPSPLRSLSYTQAPLKACQVVEVFVTAVNSPEDFWCQFAKTEDDLNVVMDNIQSSFIHMGENPRPQDMHLRPGQACLAQCAQDGYWYRSEVTEVMGDSVNVLCVDNGKTQTVSSNKVRAIEAGFMDLHRQSFRCQLAGVSPRKEVWDQDAVDTFKKMTSDHSLMADILKLVKSGEGNTTDAVVILHDGAISLSDLLVEKGLAQAVEVHQYKEEEMDRSFGEQILKTSPWEGPKYEQPVLPSGEKQEVVVLSVTSPSEFYCRAVESDQSGIPAKIRSELERHIGEMIGLSRLVPGKGMPCVAKCEDEIWQRVEILDVLQNDRVKVFLVDQAVTQEISIDNLQLITSTLLGLPLQAVKCSLEPAPSGSDWSEADTMAFRELIEGKTLQAELAEGGVQLFDGDESIMQTLVQKAADRNAKLLQGKSEKNSEVNEVTQPEVPIVEEEDEIFTERDNLPDSFKQAFPTLDLKADQKVTLCLVTVDSPDEITCQIDHEEQKVLDIEQQMTEVYAENTQTNQDTNWVPKVGEPCAAKHSKYDDWYRATVVSVDQQLGVKVFYADYGGTDSVLFESVRELEEELKQLPAQAMKFHLNKPLMPLTKWNKKTKAIMEGQDTERDLHAKILEVQENVVIVELAEEDHSFLTHLVDQSQTSSVDNEDEEREGEFFDAVDQASTEEEETYEDADIDRALESIPADTATSGDTRDDVQKSIAEIVEDLFEKAAKQALDDQKSLEAKDEDTSSGSNQKDSTNTSSVPPFVGGPKMISMKDILDQFVDHTLQKINEEDNGGDIKQTDEQEADSDNCVEDEVGHPSDGDDEEQEIQEVVNGDLADEEETSETGGETLDVEDSATTEAEYDRSEKSEESAAVSLPDDAEQGTEDQPDESAKDSDENQQNELPATELGSEDQNFDDQTLKEPELIDQQDGHMKTEETLTTETRPEPQTDERQATHDQDDSAKEMIASVDPGTVELKEGQVLEDQPSVQDSEAEVPAVENLTPVTQMDAENVSDDLTSAREEPAGDSPNLPIDTEEVPPQSAEEEGVEVDPVSSPLMDIASEIVKGEESPTDAAVEVQNGYQATPGKEQSSGQEDTAMEQAAAEGPDEETQDQDEKQPELES
ncbi:uncharacterized protein LOC110988589 [Acanthaster planci]|uniref:Uncharacterized protein LOC110988589 n=1 Tax=Acanthaster planci TaxID=133434 RepID=A0A8B7ZT07_ACAPL|nr:uncharacterized protein LOC110988589 [Acanthaster planci]